MAPSESPSALKGLLRQVKSILDDEDKRLQDEASKYEIFTTKTSASGASNLETGEKRKISTDLKRTISDISTLNSILSCPIFNRIVNVKDSLDKLSYHLSVHPSISPSDINIDANGELILAPPLEPASLNNLINSRLDEYSDHSNLSPHISSPDVMRTHTNKIGPDEKQIANQIQPAISNGNPSGLGCGNGFNPMPNDLSDEQMLFNVPQHMRNGQIYPHEAKYFNNEKLVSNNIRVGNAQPVLYQGSREESFVDEGCRLYKSNGNYSLYQPNSDDLGLKNDFKSDQSIGHTRISLEEDEQIGYSNKMYESSQEFNNRSAAAIDQIEMQSNSLIKSPHNIPNQAVATNGRVQLTHSSEASYIRSSCSPSISAGSTVRLADECDSGASSLNQSHYQKSNLNSPHHYKLNESRPESFETTNNCVKETKSRREPELVPDLSPEIEKIKVTLEKDESGLGIIVAGYTCEKEEISGIFIKSITPNGPADRSGKVKILDQVFSVDGRILLGYSNTYSVSVLKDTGKIVTLELMRYMAESNFQNLQSALAQAVPTTNFIGPKSAESSQSTIHNNTGPSPSNTEVSTTESSIPVSRSRESSLSPTKPIGPTSGKQALVQISGVSTNGATNLARSPTKDKLESSKVNAVEFLNSLKTSETRKISSPMSPDRQSLIPVAAQRAGSNKVIETKQGARNTIDIRLPSCQTLRNQSYNVNKLDEMKASDPSKNTNISNETSNEFGKFFRSTEPEWEKDAQIIEFYKDSTQGLGFTVKDYDNPMDQNQSILMITCLTPGGIAEKDGRLSPGDLLLFVDDTNLEGASPHEAAKAFKRSNGQVRLGVLKLKRA